MAKATKVTKAGKKAGKPIKTSGRKAGEKKMPAVKKTAKTGKADLDRMFREAVAQNEEFRITEADDYDIAIEHFNKIMRRLEAILAIDPAYRDAINYKGMMLVGCGSNAEAIECFEAILKSNPADKEALNNKGIALYGLGRDEEALKCIDGAIALDGRYPDAYMNKAVILHALGRYEEADKVVRRARMLDVITG